MKEKGRGYVSREEGSRSEREIGTALKGNN
jgi:hypothetical protein